MMSENYNEFVRAYQPNSAFYHAISMMVYRKVGAKDICKIGKIYALHKDRKEYIEWLKKGVEHTFVNDDMYCTHENSIGANFSVMQKACEYIKEEILNKPKENKELFVKHILSKFSATYKLIEPIFTKSQYKEVREILETDSVDFELSSEEFVSWAFSTYQRFVNNLYIICLENGLNLEEIQAKYALPISHRWNWQDTDYIIAEEEYRAMCSMLKRPFKTKHEKEIAFISPLPEKELYRIHSELQSKGYLKGSVLSFVSAMKATEAETPLKWEKKNIRSKKISLSSLHNLLYLMGCKDKKQAAHIALIYFGVNLHRNTAHMSEYDAELKEIVRVM